MFSHGVDIIILFFLSEYSSIGNFDGGCCCSARAADAGCVAVVVAPVADLRGEGVIGVFGSRGRGEGFVCLAWLGLAMCWAFLN